LVSIDNAFTIKGKCGAKTKSGLHRSYKFEDKKTDMRGQRNKDKETEREPIGYRAGR
jgi:hypothetical protein